MCGQNKSIFVTTIATSFFVRCQTRWQRAHRAATIKYTQNEKKFKVFPLPVRCASFDTIPNQINAPKRLLQNTVLCMLAVHVVRYPISNYIQYTKRLVLLLLVYVSFKKTCSRERRGHEGLVGMFVAFLQNSMNKQKLFKFCSKLFCKILWLRTQWNGIMCVVRCSVRRLHTSNGQTMMRTSFRVETSANNVFFNVHLSIFPSTRWPFGSLSLTHCLHHPRALAVEWMVEGAKIFVFGMHVDGEMKMIKFFCWPFSSHSLTLSLSLRLLTIHSHYTLLHTKYTIYGLMDHCDCRCMNVFKRQDHLLSTDPIKWDPFHHHRILLSSAQFMRSHSLFDVQFVQLQGRRRPHNIYLKKK